MRASFFLRGKGIAAGRDLGVIDMRQIAPTLARDPRRQPERRQTAAAQRRKVVPSLLSGSGATAAILFFSCDKFRSTIPAMSRIPTIAYEQADPAAQEIFDHYKKERGNVPNMFRTVAHRPEILRTMIAHFRAVMETGTVGVKLKELVIVRTSQTQSVRVLPQLPHPARPPPRLERGADRRPRQLPHPLRFQPA